jgi:hypothetical protein
MPARFRWWFSWMKNSWSSTPMLIFQYKKLEVRLWVWAKHIHRCCRLSLFCSSRLLAIRVLQYLLLYNLYNFSSKLLRKWSYHFSNPYSFFIIISTIDGWKEVKKGIFKCLSIWDTVRQFGCWTIHLSNNSYLPISQIVNSTFIYCPISKATY